MPASYRRPPAPAGPVSPRDRSDAATDGVWGMPTELLQTLPGYGGAVEKNREEARGIMRKLGYGPDKRINVKLSTRDIPPFRDPAVILIDQLKQVYIDAELEPIARQDTDGLLDCGDLVRGVAHLIL